MNFCFILLQKRERKKKSEDKILTIIEEKYIKKDTVGNFPTYLMFSDIALA